MRLIATSSHKGTPLDQADLKGATAIFFGNEGAGLPRDVMAKMDEIIAIPHTAQVESLNAGVAASIVLYEAARQRKVRTCSPQSHRDTEKNKKIKIHGPSPIIGAAIEVHRHLGPGLLESAYEECLCHELHLRGIDFRTSSRSPGRVQRVEARLWIPTGLDRARRGSCRVKVR